MEAKQKCLHPDDQIQSGLHITGACQYLPAVCLACGELLDQPELEIIVTHEEDA